MTSILEVVNISFDAIIDQLALLNGIDIHGLSLVYNKSELIKAISENSDLLSDILEITGVDIIDLEDISKLSEDKPSLIDLDNIFSGRNITTSFDANNVLVNEPKKPTTSLDLSQRGMMNISIVWDENNTKKYSVLVTSVHAVSSLLPEGIYFMPNGQFVAVSNNIAIKGTREAPQPTLQFSDSSYIVDESSLSISIVLTRTYNSNGAISVDYATSDGTAVAGSDYISTSGTLKWNDHDVADKSFLISIINDNITEGSETINLTLSNFSGAVSGNIVNAKLIINDNPLAEAVKRADDANIAFQSDISKTPEKLEEAVEKTKYLLELATKMIEHKDITPEKASIALSVVGNTLELIGQAAKENGVDVDTESVLYILQLVSNISTLAIESIETSSKEFDSIYNSIDAILKSLPTNIASIDIDNALAILAQVDDIITAGLIAGLSGTATNTEVLIDFIDGISDLITNLVLDTGITGNTKIVRIVVDIISNAVTAIHSRGNQNETFIVDQLQNETDSIIQTIHSNMLHHLLW